MTEQAYIATTPRTGHPFTFTRIRTVSGSATSQQFLPGEGTRLHFANRATDTLEIVGVPTGFLLAGDTVTVAYKGPSDQSAVTVFRGEVDTRVKDLSRGDTAAETVTVTGPWAKMARLVYRQWWQTGSGYKRSSRLILNQSKSGSAQTLNEALSEIVYGGNNTAPNAGDNPSVESGWGYQAGTISVSTQNLPFDPTRDITIAEAIIRELKFFPAAVASLDYSFTPPKLNITLPTLSGSDAAYVASIPKTHRQYTYNAHPVDGVDLEIETVVDVDGVQYRDITHQTAGNTAISNPNCLYATLQLAGFSSSSVVQVFNSVTEPIYYNGSGGYFNGIMDEAFWKDKHPYLANIPLTQGSIQVKSATRSGAADANDYPNISKNSVGEIQAAGLRARVERFTATVKIVRTGGLNSGVEEIEDDVILTMDFVTTNATTKTYRWVESTEGTSGETVPSGLAAAILEARSGALKEERFTMRLGTAAQWPKLGDLCDHLVLQEFDVDCTDLTAELHFGTPDYLSPDDMAALMTGFRNKARSTFYASRSTGNPEDYATSEIDMGGVMPLSSTEFSPGLKSKTTLKSNDVGAGGTVVVDATGASPKNVMTSTSKGKINLDTNDVPADDEVKVRTLTVIDENNSSYLVHVPMCRDVTINLKTGKIITGGGGASGDGNGSGGDIPLPSGGGGGGGGMFTWVPLTRTMGKGGAMVGRTWIDATYGGSQGPWSSMQDGTYYLKVTFGSNGSATAEVVTSPVTTSSTMCTIPIYTITNGLMMNDLRGAFVVPAYD